MVDNYESVISNSGSIHVVFLSFRTRVIIQAVWNPILKHLECAISAIIQAVFMGVLYHLEPDFKCVAS